MLDQAILYMMKTNPFFSINQSTSSKNVRQSYYNILLVCYRIPIKLCRVEHDIVNIQLPTATCLNPSLLFFHVFLIQVYNGKCHICWSIFILVGLSNFYCFVVAQNYNYLSNNGGLKEKNGLLWGPLGKNRPVCQKCQSRFLVPVCP